MQGSKPDWRVAYESSCCPKPMGRVPRHLPALDATARAWVAIEHSPHARAAPQRTHVRVYRDGGLRGGLPYRRLGGDASTAWSYLRRPSSKALDVVSGGRACVARRISPRICDHASGAHAAAFATMAHARWPVGHTHHELCPAGVRYRRNEICFYKHAEYGDDHP